ncbi:hypothetical protein QTP86_024554 [Hemibagrus guttatus]|nr:hypothetical protein QTP86_024554 [Hemibagrus guttatus]
MEKEVNREAKRAIKTAMMTYKNKMEHSFAEVCISHLQGADNAKVSIIDTIHKHLFADFSSAFNTLQPHILARKLSSHFHLDDQLILWIIDFLTNQIQRILVNKTFSGLLQTSTGSPQGCVLSQLLFIPYH